MKPFSRAFNRDVSIRKALHKKRISEYRYWYANSRIPYYDNLHQYSKNKIHCSCPICSAKTKNKGHRRYSKGNYNKSYNYKISDLRKQMALEYDENETLSSLI